MQGWISDIYPNLTSTCKEFAPVNFCWEQMVLIQASILIKPISTYLCVHRWSTGMSFVIVELCVCTHMAHWIIGWTFNSVLKQSILQFRVVPGRPSWRPWTLFWRNSDCLCEACLWPHHSLPIPFLLDPAAFPRQEGLLH